MYNSYDIFTEKILNDDVLPYYDKTLKTKALNIIADALYLMYNSYNLDTLIIRCELETEAPNFSKQLCTVLDKKNEDESIWIVIKDILKTLPVSIFFINELHRPIQDYYKFVIPTRVKNQANYDKNFYIDLIDRYRTVLNATTINAFKKYFMFALRFLKKYNFHDNKFDKFTHQDIIKFCYNDQFKLNKLKLFLTKVLNQDIPNNWFNKVKIKFTLITTKDIENIYLHIKDQVYKELIFLLLLTTKLKMFCLLRIKIKNINISERYGIIERKNSPKFLLCPRIITLMDIYITKIRDSDSEYLFTKSYKTIQLVVKKITNKCGVNTKRFKPSIFGQTYARSLANCGNTSDDVLKCLKNI